MDASETALCPRAAHLGRSEVGEQEARSGFGVTVTSVTVAQRLRRCVVMLVRRWNVALAPVDEGELEARRAAVEARVSVQRGPDGGPFACPCCS